MIIGDVYYDNIGWWQRRSDPETVLGKIYVYLVKSNVKYYSRKSRAPTEEKMNQHNETKEEEELNLNKSIGIKISNN